MMYARPVHKIGGLSGRRAARLMNGRKRDINITLNYKKI